jgi:hypothetical protein
MLIRTNANLEELAQEMLDLIPEKYFKSSTATFLDPAMGGGQFVVAIENRLAEYGHSDENIAERVCGMEPNWKVQIAKNRHNLKGQYEVADFLEEDNMLEPDVTIGNPPFQKTFNGERKAKVHNLWSEFAIKAMETSDNVALILPDGWMSSGMHVFESMKEFGLKYVNLNCSKFFPGVGIRFTYVVLEKGYTGMTKVVDAEYEYEFDLRNMDLITPIVEHWSILEKMTANDEKMGWRRGQGYSTRLGGGHMATMKQDKTYGKIKVIHTNPQTYYTDIPRGDVGVRKVISTISGYFIPIYDRSGRLGGTQATVVLPTDDIDGAERLLNTKLFKFLGTMAKQQGWINLKLMKALGHIPLDRAWTDNKVYKFYGLTQDEIELVESYEV